MIEAEARLWVTGETDEQVDALLRAIADLGLIGSVNVRLIEQRREFRR